LIERFNFYDVFGFFIPGSVLLLVLWAPFGIIEGRGPTTELTSAVIAIVAAYLTGHFLQAWATRAYPSSKGDRARSTIMLDDAEETLQDEDRKAFAIVARREFGLDIAGPGGDAACDGRRVAAFFRARERLVATETASYAEQFQGLYTMMRGNMVATVSGAYYLFGWVISVSRLQAIGTGILVLVVATGLAIVGYGSSVQGSTARERKDRERRHARQLMNLFPIMFVLIGFVAGGSAMPTIPQRFLLLGAFAVMVAVAAQSARSYEQYADEFAKAVYRGFIELSSKPSRRDPFD
jgi:hypothetical protein